MPCVLRTPNPTYLLLFECRSWRSNGRTQEFTKLMVLGRPPIVNSGTIKLRWKTGCIDFEPDSQKDCKMLNFRLVSLFIPFFGCLENQPSRTHHNSSLRYDDISYSKCQRQDLHLFGYSFIILRRICFFFKYGRRKLQCLVTTGND